jgi:hypothetical protein
LRRIVSACRAFRRNKTEQGHQLSWRIEGRTSPISAAKGHGDKKRCAAHLIGLDDRRHGPLRHDEGELLLERAQTLKRLSATGKKLPIVVAAIAGEMAAFLRAIGREIAPA